MSTYNELQILYIRERFRKVPEPSAGSRRRLDISTLLVKKKHTVSDTAPSVTKNTVAVPENLWTQQAKHELNINKMVPKETSCKEFTQSGAQDAITRA